MKNVKLNMNGDDGEVLGQQLRVAVDALEAAHAAVTALTIHQRNYQTYMEPSEYYRMDYDDKRQIQANLCAAIEWCALSYVGISDKLAAIAAAKSPAYGEL